MLGLVDRKRGTFIPLTEIDHNVNTSKCIRAPAVFENFTPALHFPNLDGIVHYLE